jgi:hypothetical protein
MEGRLAMSARPVGVETMLRFFSSTYRPLEERLDDRRLRRRRSDAVGFSKQSLDLRVRDESRNARQGLQDCRAPESLRRLGALVVRADAHGSHRLAVTQGGKRAVLRRVDLGLLLVDVAGVAERGLSTGRERLASRSDKALARDEDLDLRPVAPERAVEPREVPARDEVVDAAYDWTQGSRRDARRRGDDRVMSGDLSSRSRRERRVKSAPATSYCSPGRFASAALRTAAACVKCVSGR